MSGHHHNSACSNRFQRSSHSQRCQNWVASSGQAINSGSSRASSERRSDRDYYPPTLPPLYENAERRQASSRHHTAPSRYDGLPRRSDRDAPSRASNTRSHRSLRPEDSITRLDFAQEGPPRAQSNRAPPSRYSDNRQNRERALSYRSQVEHPPSNRRSEYGGTEERLLDRLAWEARRMAGNTEPQLVCGESVERTRLRSGMEVDTYEVAPAGATLRSAGGGQAYGNSQAGRRSGA